MKVEENINICKFINNEIFISLLTNIEPFLNFCIKEICKEVDIEIDYNDLLVTYNTIPINRINEKFKQVDIVASNKENVINIEANNIVNKITRKKNTGYLMKMYSEDTSKGEDYDPNKMFVQLNFDNGNDKELGDLSKASLLTMEKHPVVDNFYLVFLDIAKCYKKFYNLVNEGKEEKIPNYVRIGTLFYSNNPDEVDTILGNMLDINLKKRVMNKIKEMCRMNPDYSLTDEMKEKYADMLYFGWKREYTEEGKKEGLKEGRKEGIIQGIQQKAKEMIKLMLSKKMSYQDISDISGETISKIKEIEKSMK